MENSIVQDIIKMEWDMFKNVNNQGGKASCQNDKQTFFIMRQSQLLSWNESLLRSYNNDLLNAITNNRNLMTEKYAYMMKSSSPQEFEKIKKYLPFLSKEQLEIIEKICSIQVKWYIETIELYPAVAGRGRSVRTIEDRPGAVSFETYLRGELSIYSYETQKLYFEYICQLENKGLNMNLKILENTVRAYGYLSLDNAERSLKTF